MSTVYLPSTHSIYCKSFPHFLSQSVTMPVVLSEKNCKHSVTPYTIKQGPKVFVLTTNQDLLQSRSNSHQSN